MIKLIQLKYQSNIKIMDQADNSLTMDQQVYHYPINYQLKMDLFKTIQYTIAVLRIDTISNSLRINQK